MPCIIRLNDPTSHGGKVIGATGDYFVMGLSVARVGDTCSCPHRGHDGCVIAEGDPNFIVDGRAVAFEGHKTSCGASLIATVSNFEKG
jgi:uncharacterized Zn-binding protein involved in type VI secretion